MYISELSIENFRSFDENTTVYFNEGTNVIIGQNNAGKTTIIKALDLLFNNKTSKRLTIKDFNRDSNTTVEKLIANPPKITISAKLVEAKKRAGSEENYSDELITVSTWLTKIESPYEATITFEFFLPEKEVKEYKAYLTKHEQSFKDINDCWKAIEHTFLRKYTSKIYVGNPEFKNLLQPEDINRFDFQFLDAIRDVERDLYKGNNSLLREVIDFFMDYDIKNDPESKKEEKNDQILDRKIGFSTEANKLIETLQERMKSGEEEILKYVSKTGAGVDESTPTFDGTILDTELYSALRLIVQKKSGIKLPAISNGLGYNNLIYISLLLSKMQKDASGEYLGANAKVFSMLAIEEPEAHLHPNMQYKFLKFLKENRETDVNQIFITSHSPNITAAVDLDDIIVVQKVDEGVRAAYPGKVFCEKNKEDMKSKNYVKRFLDVTKADLFFAENIILVEGISEQLVIPEFAIRMNKDLSDSHTSIINIGGRFFDHFLKLFDTNRCDFAISKKVACITDLDPVRKLLTDTTDDTKNWKKCTPIFLNLEKEKYAYKTYSNKTVENPVFSKDGLIRVFSQEKGKSSTFEYDLLLQNPTSELLITESVSNGKEIKELMRLFKEDKPLKKLVKELGKNKFSEEVRYLVDLKRLTGAKETKQGLIASRYLNSIKKGEVAQELAEVVSLDVESKISPPDYIRRAIEWICPAQKN